MYNRRPRGSQTIVGSQSIANKDDAAFRSASAPPTIVGLVEGRNHGISGEKTMTASALRLSAIFVMVLAGSTGAQRDAPRPSDGSAVIRGRVVAGDTLAPLRDVTLSLHHADKVPTIRTGVQVVDQSTFLPGLTVRPDANGQFELVGVPPGRYRLGATPGPRLGQVSGGPLSGSGRGRIPTAHRRRRSSAGADCRHASKGRRDLRARGRRERQPAGTRQRQRAGDAGRRTAPHGAITG